MSRTRYTPRERSRFEAAVRAFVPTYVCEHDWEYRPQDVFSHRCRKCGAWAKGSIPPAVGRKREVFRGI